MPRTTLQTLVKRGIVELGEEAAGISYVGHEAAQTGISLHACAESRTRHHQQLGRRTQVPADAAARRYRLGQNRGLSFSDAGGAGKGPFGYLACSRDRSHSGDGGRSAPDLRRRSCHSAFRPERRRARRAVETHPQRRVSHCGRNAVGCICPCSRPIAHRGGRGARSLLQAGRDAALSRARRCGDAGQDVQRRRGSRLGHALAGDLLQRATREVPADRISGAHREAAVAGSRNHRHARGISAHQKDASSRAGWWKKSASGWSAASRSWCC